MQTIADIKNNKAYELAKLDAEHRQGLMMGDTYVENMPYESSPAVQQQAEPNIDLSNLQDVTDNPLGAIQSSSDSEFEFVQGSLPTPVSFAKGIESFTKDIISNMPNATELEHTELYEAYFRNDTERAKERRRIADALGIDARTFKDDRELYTQAAKSAAELEKYKQFKEFLKADGTVNMQKIYDTVPGLAKIQKEKGLEAAALALGNINGIKKINEIYDNELSRFAGSIQAGWERNNLTAEKNEIYAKAAREARRLTSDEEAQVKDINDKLNQIAGFSYGSTGAVLGAMLGGVAENAEMFKAQIYGTVAGGAAAGATMYSGIGAFGAGTAYKVTSNVVSTTVMANQIMGAQYEELLNKKDKYGRPMYTPGEAATLAGVQGLSEAALEQWTFGQMGRAIMGKPAAVALKDILAKSALKQESELATKASLGAVIKDRLKDAYFNNNLNAKGLKEASSVFANSLIAGTKAGIASGASELKEEFLQQASNMILEDVWQAYLKGDKAEIAGLEDILASSTANAIMAIPTVAGFGILGFSGNRVFNNKYAQSSMNKGLGLFGLHQTTLAEYENSRMVKSEVENNHRFNIISNTNEAIANGALEDLQGANRDIAVQILDEKNVEVDAEYTYVDIKALNQMEGGAELVNKIAEAENLNQEDIQQASTIGEGMLAVKTSSLQLMQLDSTAKEKLKDNIASADGSETNNRIKEGVKRVREAMARVRKFTQTGQVDEDIVNQAIKDNFGDELEQAIAKELYGQGMSLKAYRESIINELESDAEGIAPILEFMRETAKQGVSYVENRERDDIGAVKRVSNNLEWYRAWAKDHPGKAWSDAEARYIAYEALMGNDTYDVLGYVGMNQLPTEELEASRNKAKELWNRLEKLDDKAFTDKIKTLTTEAIMATADLSPEARAEYIRIAQEFKASTNRDVARAGEVSTILLLHMADSLVRQNKDAGIDYTIQDALNALRFDVNGSIAKEGGLNQFIGEEGAARLDAAEELTTRMDNLNVAREMEKAHKNAKTIKFATGWERGADNKWRYEIDDSNILLSLKGDIRFLDDTKYQRMLEVDAKIMDLIMEGEKPNQELLDESKSLHEIFSHDINELYDKINNGESFFLSDILKHDELFKAYPKLRNLKVAIFDLGGEYNGWYDGNIIAIDKSLRISKERLKSTLLHEIQHAIQNQEGFARGTIPQNAKENIRKELSQFEDYAGSPLRQYTVAEINLSVIDYYKDRFRFRNNPKEFTNTSMYLATKPFVMPKDKKDYDEKLSELISQWEKDGLEEIKQYYFGISAWIDDSIENAIYEYESMSLKELEEAEIAESDVANANRTQAEKMEKAEGILDKIDMLTDFETYRRYAGEVESRNVQSRMNMSMEERLNSLASETEDVAREDQYALNVLTEQVRSGSTLLQGNKNISSVENNFDLSDIAEEKLTKDEEKFVAEIKEFIAEESREERRNNKEKSEPKTLMKTPLVAELVGGRTLDLRINVRTLIKSLRQKHSENMADDIIELLPRELCNPIAILKNRDEDGKILEGQVIFVTSVRVDEGGPVIVPVVFGKGHEAYATNKVKTIFSKNSLEWYINRLEAGDCLYINKKRSQLTVGDIGHQSSDHAVKTSYLNNIPNENDLVNLRLQKNTLYQSASEEKNLAAYHNTNAASLQQALASGGLAVPSLAITDKSIPFDNFGSITLVGNADLINPANGTDVYSRDAYTTRMPKPEYKAATTKSVNAWIKKHLDTFKKLGANETEVRRIITVAYNYPEEFQRELERSPEFLAYYLSEIKGKKLDLPKQSPEYQNEFLRDETVVNDIEKIFAQEMSEDERAKALVKPIETVLTKQIAEKEKEIKDTEAAVERALAAGKNMRAMLFKERVEKKQRELESVKVNQEYYFEVGEDNEKRVNAQEIRDMKRAIDSVADVKKNAPIDWRWVRSYLYDQYRNELESYDDFVKQTMQELMGEPRLKIGNKYVPYTLDNIVKAMVNKRGAGQEAFVMNTSKLAGVGAKKYSSIEDIRKDKGNLRTKEQMDAIIQELDQYHDSIVKELVDNHGFDEWGLNDELNEALAEVIKGGNKATPAKVKRALAKHDIEGLTNEELNKVVKVANNYRDAATWYFEAKPQRAVGINEFSGAVVPVGTDENLIKQLQNLGLQVETYVNSADRQEAVNRIHEQQNTLFQQNNQIKGQFNYSGNAQDGYVNRLISLFDAADESTFFHEASHAYLLELERLATLAPESRAAKDFETIKGWASWNKGQYEEYKGTATEAEFYNLEQKILKAEKDGYIQNADGTTETIESLKERWMQERFARGFEEYLRKGDVPAPALKKPFRRIKRWLMSIYKIVSNGRTMEGAGARASAEVEAIMARMVASDEMIETMHAMNVLDGSELDGDMSSEDVKAMHERWKEEAKEQAKERMLSKLLTTYKKEVKDKLDAFRKEREPAIREELQQEPYFAVDAVVEEGVPLETALEMFGYQENVSFTAEQQYKQDKRKYNNATLDEVVNAKLDEETNNLKKQMPSTQQMREQAIEALANEKQGELIALEAELLRRREQKYNEAGGKLGAAFEEVDKAITQGDINALKRKIKELRYSQRWKEAELKYFAEMDKALLREDIADEKEKVKQVKEMFDAFRKNTLQNLDWMRGVRDAATEVRRSVVIAARNDIMNMPLRVARSISSWNRQAGTAANNAVKNMIKGATLAKEGKMEESKQAYDEAHDNKVEQLYDVEMVRQAVKVNRKVNSILNKVKNRKRALSKRKLPALNRYYYEHLLYLYGLQSTDAIPPSELTNFNDFWTELTAGLEVEFEVDSNLVAMLDGNEKHPGYTHLTMYQLEDLMSLADVLYTTGINANRLLTMDVDIETIAAEANDDWMNNVAVTVTNNKIEDIKGAMGGYMSSIIKPEVLLRLTGGKEGAFIKYIYNILWKATENEARAKEQEAKEIKELVDNFYTREELKQFDKPIDGVTLSNGEALSKNNVLSMALNWGNKTNQARLIVGLDLSPNEAVTRREIESIFAKTLTRKDWEFVQSIWNHIGRYGDEVNKVVEKLNGVPMKRVQADSFEITISEDGADKKITVAGGYYPIVADPKHNADADEKAELEAKAGIMGGNAALGSGQGSTKNRSASMKIKRMLLLDLGVISKHINQQIHIANMRLACRDAYKVLNNQTVANAIQQTWGNQVYKDLKSWVVDIWSPSIGTGVAEHFIGKLRSNTISAIMSYRVSTALLNFANISPMIGKIGWANTIKAMTYYAGHFREVRSFVLNDSVWMRNRANNMDRDLEKVQADLFDPGNPLKRTVDKYSNWLIEQTDMMCSVPLYHHVYMETYNKLVETMDEQEAREQAHMDAHEAVRSIFGSADTVDASKIQRSKNEFDKLLTPFFSFANTMFNAVAEKYYSAKVSGQRTRTVAEDGSVIETTTRGDVVKKYAEFLQKAFYHYIFMSAIETALRMGVDALTDGGGDDKEPEELLYSYLGDWSKNAVNSMAGGFYGFNMFAETLMSVLYGEKTFGRGGSMGVIGGTASRIENLVKAVPKLLEGKQDWIDFGRNVTKVGTSYTGFSDTLVDSAWNTARFIADDFEYDDMDAWREYLMKSVFDRKLKAKK